jgi:hypothetical protein
LDMLNDVAFEGLVVETKICALWIKIFLFQIIAVVTIEIANRPDRLDHDLKLTCRSLQRATSSYINSLGLYSKKRWMSPPTGRELKAARRFYKLTDCRPFKGN